ncbi:DUF2306 domain-containing protein [Pseudonocardia kujensis]|uniref:DUF2306 domain-containing protein n=1 Tax=Pseudonocardia kujensis TaxID=1128675 RepID=UPI001E5C19D6|nr:DUF2306 domain-containing protein [Pseudonocardia kujensis]MCE0762766.1 DUF2306 domain-containing protein [Pseudonocardia kujensis]
MTAPTAPPLTPRVPLRRRPWVLPLGLLAVLFLVTALPPYLGLDPARSRVPPQPDLPHFYPMLVAHIAFGSVALLTSVLQVWPWLRRSHPRVHRWSGRLYLFAGVFPGGLAVLTVAPFGEMGPVQQAGNTALGALWLVTGVLGYRAARRGRYAQHRAWMVRSVALTWSIVANRVWSPLCLAVYAPGALSDADVAHSVIAQAIGVSVWASWVLNLIVAEWWLAGSARWTARPVRTERLARQDPDRRR